MIRQGNPNLHETHRARPHYEGMKIAQSALDLRRSELFEQKQVGGVDRLCSDFNDIDRATFFALLQFDHIFSKGQRNMESSLLGGTHEMRQAVIVHLEILRRRVGTQPTTDAFRLLVVNFEHNSSC